MITRRWQVQTAWNPWLSVGLHLDHTDPSITIHLPGVIIYMGRCKQPGFKPTGFKQPGFKEPGGRGAAGRELRALIDQMEDSERQGGKADR